MVLLHGIANVPLSMKYLEEYLKKEGYEVLNLGYPTTDVTIEKAADVVRKRIEQWSSGRGGGDGTVSIVAHSMGNIVTRKAMEAGLAGIHRMVMIAPPNRGSLTAQQLKDLKAYQWVFGPAGQQLSSGNITFFADLPAPSCQFGIIAGGKGDGEGYNPLLPGDDDGTVRVAETRLDGAADFVLVQNTHTMLLFDRETADQVVHFLRYGRFKH